MKQYDIFFDESNNIYQIRTKQDVIVIEFSDEKKEDIFKAIIDLYEKEDFYTFKQLQKKIAIQYPYEKFIDVVQELLNCSVLNTNNFEKNCDNVFQPQDSPKWIHKEIQDLNSLTLGFIGDKVFGKKVKEKALLQGYNKCNLLETGPNLNIDEVYSIFDICNFVIVDLSNWNPLLIEKINEYALSKNYPWFLIEGLIDPINFSIGPIFYGRETGCYECYSSRLRSNDEFVTYNQSYERYLRLNNRYAKPDEVSILIKDLAATIIIIDISKFIGGWYVSETWRATLVLNTSNFNIIKHDFLKAPYCVKCKPELDYNQFPWFDSVTLKEKKI